MNIWKKHKKKAIRISLIITAGFVLLFVFRLIYGYTNHPDGQKQQEYVEEQYSNDFEFSKNNYASEFKSKGYKQKAPSSSGEALMGIDQKYEKIASITSKTREYNKDEKKIRKIIKKYNALIQYEQKAGNKKNRKLLLAIGVNPSKFDTCINEIRKIGKITSFKTNKYDKTNEFRELEAKRISLEKIRTSLIELKTHNGTIRERIELDNRILEIEEQIQRLGVSLGDYDAENEFCTVKFSLLERPKQVIVSISLIHRLKVAFEWSVKIYFRILMIIAFMLLITYMLILIGLKITPKKNISS